MLSGKHNWESWGTFCVKSVEPLETAYSYHPKGLQDHWTGERNKATFRSLSHFSRLPLRATKSIQSFLITSGGHLVQTKVISRCAIQLVIKLRSSVKVPLTWHCFRLVDVLLQVHSKHFFLNKGFFLPFANLVDFSLLFALSLCSDGDTTPLFIGGAFSELDMQAKVSILAFYHSEVFSAC